MKGYSFRSLTDLVLKIFKTKVNAGTGLSGGGSLEADRTLAVKYGTTAGTAAQGNDNRLSNSREWIAETISQVEAEAGTASTRRAFTAQRVRQAIVAWWNSITSVFGRDLATSANNTDARSKLGLGTSATRNVGTASGNVLEVNAGGWLGQAAVRNSPYDYPASVGDDTNLTKVIRSEVIDNGVFNFASGIHFAAGNTWGRLRVLHSSRQAWIQGGWAATGSGWTSQVVLSANLLQTTGSTTDFPMSQKAVTDQLATKAALSHTHPWSQVTGQPATATRWPTLAEVSDRPTNYPTTWNSVAAKPAQATRWPTFAEVVGKPETYTPSSHTHPTSQITGLDAALSAKASTSTRVIAGTGLTGGGTLAANQTLAIEATHFPIGVGQTWQNVTTSRAININYTNTTGRTIVVVASDSGTHSTGGVIGYVNGVEVYRNMFDRDTSGGRTSALIIVPPGAIYRMHAIPSLGHWIELR